MRAVSTVLDVGLALLLIGGAIAVVVAGVPVTERPDAGTDPADAVARDLTTTARVNYTVAGPDGSVRRHAHGTVASLLAAAARANVTVDGRSLPSSPSFEHGIRAVTRGRVSRPDVAVGVTATWRPYRGAPVAGHLHVGERPPADTDVRAAVLRVPVSAPATCDRALRAAQRDGFAGVARVLARGTVRALYPRNDTFLGGTADARLSADRYAASAAALGVDLPAARNATAANDRLAAALTDRFETDIRRQYATPSAAARNASTGTARVVVRTWSP